MGMTPEAFRRVMSKFATGVTIVTVRNNQEIHGLTVNAFTSVSLEPPLVLICIKKNGQSHEHLSAADGFVVNILSAGQEELAMRFANSALSSEERFAGVRYRPNAAGIPVLEGVLGHLGCRISERFDGGDHTIFLGKVEETGVNDGLRPLLFYESGFHTL